MNDVQHVVVNGVRLAVAVRGEGPAIMFVHGYPLDRTIWSHQLAALDGWCRIAPDLRGMGQSEAPDSGYSMATYAGDLAALLDSLGVGDVVLCGLSMGGYVAFEFLRRWRERVRGLVLMDTRAEADSAEWKQARDAAAAVVRNNGTEAIADQMLPKLLASGTLERAPDIVQRVRTMLVATPVAGIIGALGAMKERRDSTPLLTTLNGLPTLVVVGREDQVTPPEQALGMVRTAPGAHLVVIPGAAHLPPVEQPEATTAALQTFLKRL